jgi:hypothetical protein
MNLRIETKKVAELTFDPGNARAHNKPNLDAIRASLETFGQRKPIVLDSNGVVVAGNGTLQAAIALGWSEIETVSVPADWNENQIRAFAIADNRTAELAEWNQDVLALQIMELQEMDFPIAELGFELPKMPDEQLWTDTFSATSAEKQDIQQISFTLQTDQVETIKNALAKSKSLGEFGDTGNSNANGNALARIAEMWLGSV